MPNIYLTHWLPIIHKMEHYLYRHIRPDKNCPFYIGIGSKSSYTSISNDEYFRANCSYNRNRIWNSIYEKNNGIFEIEILIESDDYQFVKYREIEFIKLYGRIDLNTGTLANMTDGGDGSRRILVTQERKDKITKTHTGHSWNKGCKWNEEAKKKASEFAKERGVSKKFLEEGQKTRDSIEFKEKVGSRYRGKKLSVEHVNKMTAKKYKPIIKIDMNGKIAEEFYSLKEASVKSGNKFIVYYIKNGKPYKNHFWKYK